MNLFSISSIVLSLASILTGLFIFSQNRKSQVAVNWFVLSTVIALWGLGLYGVTSASSFEVAKNWQHLLDVAAIWIPPIALIFAFSFLSEERKSTLAIKATQYATVVIAGLLTYLSFTDFYINGFSKILGFFWIIPGSLYFLFPIFFAVAAIIFEFVFLAIALNSQNKIQRRRQAFSISIAGFFGFGGGITNFFPQLFNIYPFGNYFVILFTVFIGYSILQQHLFNTKIIASQMFASAFALLFVFNLLRSETIFDWYLGTFALLLVVAFGFLLVRSVIREVKQREEIERLAQNLEKANERLKELDKLKSQFLSIASHDLRAPLTAIRNFMSLLLDGTYGTLPPAGEEGVRQVFDRATEMAKSVDNYLNVSRIEQGRMKYDFADSDLGTILSDTADIFRPNVEEKGLALTLNIPSDTYPVRADVGKLQEVFNNLIDNAIKYTPEGSISLSLEKLGNTARITIEDTGIGMDRKTMMNLFKLFSPGENSKKINPSSTGVGLYITKAHVEAHKGTIRAESDGKGKGSRFVVELPLSI